MATKTHGRADLRALRQRLEAVGQTEDGAQSILVEAADRFLTAAGYQDEALMRSALEEAKAVLGRRTIEMVEERANNSSAAQVSIRKFTDDFEGVPLELDEQLDDLGRSLSSFVSGWLRYLTDFRDGPLRMARKHRIEVPNAAKLDEHIAYWESVKANLVDCWPWSDAPIPLPPVDREMVARSRAAFAAGEKGEDIDALIARLRSE